MGHSGCRRVSIHMTDSFAHQCVMLDKKQHFLIPGYGGQREILEQR